MADLSEDAIRARATSLWAADGQPTGKDLDYWLKAESQLLAEAAAAEAAAAAPVEPSPAVLAEPFVAPKPEIDVEAIIAEDPNQIVAPPEKPKRGWWRR